MPKRKIKRKSVYKVKSRRKTSNLSKFSFRNALFALVILILFFAIANFISSFFKLSHPKFSKEVAIKNMQQTEKTLITQYPSLTPKVTLTPIPLTGFCLRVPVLMYHHIQPENVARQLGQTALTVDSVIFDKQMEYLSQNGYKTLFADELIQALINHQNLPEKSVVITMDDGYEDNYIYALPILQKYGIRANIALASGLMNNSNMLSWDEVKSLKSSGLIYFTNHTWSHYPVVKPPQVKIEMEIDTAKKEIEDSTGQIVNVFTYPYGEFNNNAITTLQAKKYIGAISEIPGQYQCDSFLLTLHRTRIGNSSLSAYGL